MIIQRNSTSSSEEVLLSLLTFGKSIGALRPRGEAKVGTQSMGHRRKVVREPNSLNRSLPPASCFPFDEVKKVSKRAKGPCRFPQGAKGPSGRRRRRPKGTLALRSPPGAARVQGPFSFAVVKCKLNPRGKGALWGEVQRGLLLLVPPGGIQLRIGRIRTLWGVYEAQELDAPLQATLGRRAEGAFCSFGFVFTFGEAKAT